MRAIATIALLMGVGCAATIEQTGKPSLSGMIVSSTPEVLTIENDRSETFEIACNEVRGIDHPGNVVAIIGAAVAAAGVIGAFAMTDSDCSVTGLCLSRADMILTYGLMGGLPALIGGGAYLTSWYHGRECVTSRTK